MDTKSERRFSAISNRTRDNSDLFFYGVTTTKIFCLPICPSRTPRAENILYFATTAEALEMGFRPCKRCRPVSSSRLAVEDHHANLVEEAILLVALEKVHRVAELANRLNVSERQLRRIIQARFGISISSFIKQHFSTQARAT